MLNRAKSIARGDNFTVLIGNLSASAFGLVTFMLLARSLSKQDFGEWALFISAAGVLDLMRSGLVRQALVRSITIEKDEKRKEEILSSASLLTLFISIGAAIVTYLAGFFIAEYTLASFFKYYPLLALASAWNNFDTYQAHAEGKYKRMNSVRLAINFIFILVVIYGAFHKPALEFYFIAYLATNGLVSLYSYFTSIIHHSIKCANIHDLKDLLQYGKHSFVTLTGANLLKSADSLIIGWLMGKEAVAIYAIPLKVLDLVEIPLRGFVMTGFRKLAASYANNDIIGFRQHLFQNIKRMSALAFVGGAIMFCFPDPFIKILGGEGFSESNLLLQIFVLPLILLPLDKFIGVSLDAINQPKTNAIKVWIMVTVNIMGDIAVIYWIGELWAVATVTMLNIVAGIAFALINHPYVSPSFKRFQLQV